MSRARSCSVSGEHADCSAGLWTARCGRRWGRCPRFMRDLVLPAIEQDHPVGAAGVTPASGLKTLPREPGAAGPAAVPSPHLAAGCHGASVAWPRRLSAARLAGAGELFGLPQSVAYHVLMKRIRWVVAI